MAHTRATPVARIGCAAWAGRPASRTGRTQTPGLRVSLLIAGRGGVWGCDKTRDGSGAATLSSRCATKSGTPACRRCVCLTRVAGRRAGAGRAHVPPSARLPVCPSATGLSGALVHAVAMACTAAQPRRPPFRDDDASPCRRRATPNRQIQQRASRLFVFPGAAADSGRRSQQRAALA